MTIQQQLEFALSHHHAGRLAEAEQIYRRILAQQPDHIAAQYNLGTVLQNMGQLDQAIAAYEQAIRLKPDLAEAHNNLANALRDQGRLDEASTAYRYAIELNPNYAEAHNNLGNVLLEQKRFDEAITAFRHALSLKPDLADAHYNLANALKDLGQLDEAIASYRQAIYLRPDFVLAHSNLVFTLQFHPGLDAEQIYREHRLWGQRHADPLRKFSLPHANIRDPDRPLRIGYVSADFWRHAASHFFRSILEHHDRTIFEVFCYANIARSDEITERMKGFCDGWRNIAGVADQAVADLIRSDQIDILVDLSGHTAGNRLRVFARKPAPIQVTYLGYPNTTGMTAIDYRFTDALADPPGMTDQLNAEKLWRLPRCAWCFHAAEDSPDIRPREDGPITFGCFNAFAKINPPLLRIWAHILNRVPDSRLLLKSAGAGEASSRGQLTAEFARHGVAADRIEMLGKIADPRRHLELYHRVDIGLDTFPYHGTTTTCEAFWMGIPVVSLAGQTHLSRVGISLLTNLGLPELLAQSAEEYVSIAADLAANPSRLRNLRANLRTLMKSSPLGDEPRFAKDVETAYRQMWRTWCAQGKVQISE
jgi:predicted O-linked N-acetylglucosamine transferase (SPINDLY family)